MHLQGQDNGRAVHVFLGFYVRIKANYINRTPSVTITSTPFGHFVCSKKQNKKQSKTTTTTTTTTLHLFNYMHGLTGRCLNIVN